MAFFQPTLHSSMQSPDCPSAPMLTWCYTFSLLAKSMKPSAANRAQRRVWALIRRSRRGVSGAEKEHSLSKARVKHYGAWSPNGRDDRHVLGFAPALRLLSSQIMSRLYKCPSDESRSQVKDPVVHVRVWCTMETQK